MKKIIGCVVVCVFFICIQCKKNTKKPFELSKTEMWLENKTNYKNKTNYHAFFLKEYNSQIKNKNDKAAQNLLYTFGKLLYLNDSYDTLYYKECSHFVEKNRFREKDTLSNWLYFYLSQHCHMISDFDKSNYWCNKGLNNTVEKTTEVYSNLTNNIGLNYTFKNKIDKALPKFISLLPIAESKKDYMRLGSLYNNIAYCYEQVYANNESKKNYLKAGESFLKAKDTSNYFALQTTFAYNHFDISKDTLQTIKFIDDTFSVFNTFKNPVEMDICNANFTKAFKCYLLHDYKNALTYLEKSSAFYRKTNNWDFLKYNDFFKTQIEFYLNKKITNIEAVEHSAEDFYNEESLYESIGLYTILYENELISKNYQKALFYKNKVDAIQKIQLKQNENGQLYEYEQKYQAEKKEKIIAEKNNQIAKNKLYLLLTLTLLVAVILVTILFFVRKKKKEIVETNKRQERFTFQLLQNTEEERNRIANELHDSVNHDLLNIKNTIIKGKEIEINSIENVIEEVRNISRNLHPAVLQNLGFEASIESMCERLTNEAGLFVTSDIQYQKKLSKSKELQLYRIIQEALNNTLKHGKANAAKVIINSTENNLTLEIKDNGNGFNVEEQLKSVTSFGLQSMLQRAKAIAAKINIESSNKGTRIFINIPT